jgi:Lrp/AsnC family leucine-responsive transcriptional regulator
MKEIRLDLLDKRILTQLNNNPKASYSSIAKKTRSSKEVVNYRIKKLIKQGVIKEFVTIFGFGYWAYKMLIDFAKISTETEKEIIAYLTTHPNINWVTPCSGGWDLVFAIMAKDPKDFDNSLMEILKKIGNNIRDYKIATSIDSHTFGHTYILESVKESEKLKMNTEFDFDEKDKKIAQLLHKDARITLMDIAIKTKVPVDTVKYRIKKMEQNKIIKRYRLILNPSKLGYNRFEIFLRCTNLSDKVVNRFREYAKQNHHVEYFSKCTGSWDIEMTVHFKTNTKLRNFILEIKERFGEYIQKFETVTLFETYNYVSLPKELK